MKSEKGSALLIVLILVFILSIIATALFSGATRSFTASQAQASQFSEKLLIESAANDAHTRLTVMETRTNQFIHQQIALPTPRLGCTYVYTYPAGQAVGSWPAPSGPNHACLSTHTGGLPPSGQRFVQVRITHVGVPPAPATANDWQFRIAISQPQVVP